MVSKLLYTFVELPSNLSSSIYLDSEFGSTPNTSSDLKKGHIALGIPAKYREWSWLLSPLCREKGELPLLEEIKRIKGKAFARPIATVEPDVSEGGRKRSLSPARELSVDKKLKTSSATREGSSIVRRLVIDLTFPKRKKEAARSKLMKLVAPKIARNVADKIAQRRSYVVPSVPWFILRLPLVPKSSPIPKVHVAAKNEGDDFIAKAVSGPTSFIEKEAFARMSSHHQPTEPTLGEFSEIHALIKSNLLEDTEACAKFIDGVSKVVDSSFFTRHEAQS
ncbi:hypothetical protein ACFX2J_000330 [Malus domestica]